MQRQAYKVIYPLLMSHLTLYPNNLKNRESGKEGPQNLHSERATIAEWQGASENANFEGNPTQTETDFSSSLGIPACFVTGTEFGCLAKSYAEGRKSYPASLYDLIESFLPKNTKILELGCGTGIATQELFKRGYHNILSTDIDKRMLEEAQTLCPEISFESADAHALRFEDASFAASFAFGCFHWFCDEEAIVEIQRILKSDGIFIVVNKRDSGPFREKFRSFLSTLLQKSIIEPKETYRPIEALKAQGFSTSVHSLDSSETFSPYELLKFCQSTSLWNSLTSQEQQKALPDLENFVKEMTTENTFERPIEIQCLVAIKEIRP